MGSDSRSKRVTRARQTAVLDVEPGCPRAGCGRSRCAGPRVSLARRRSCRAVPVLASRSRRAGRVALCRSARLARAAPAPPPAASPRPTPRAQAHERRSCRFCLATPWSSPPRSALSSPGRLTPSLLPSKAPCPGGPRFLRPVVNPAPRLLFVRLLGLLYPLGLFRLGAYLPSRPSVPRRPRKGMLPEPPRCPLHGPYAAASRTPLPPR